MSLLHALAVNRRSASLLSLVGCGLALALCAPFDGAHAKNITVYSFK
jgi:hypothetical protein